jgi:SAM-dependent methyltransferase
MHNILYLQLLKIYNNNQYKKKMGFFVISSQNPKLGYVIFKNPQTGMIMREIRAGISYGWYSDESTYAVRFIDVPPNVSFKRHYNDEYDYLPSMQYMSPLLMNTIIQEYFNSTINKTLEDDIVCQNSVEIPTLYLSCKCKKFIDKLNQYITEIEIKYTPIENSTVAHHVVIEGNTTLQKLLQYCYLLGVILNSMISRRFIEQSTIDKIVGIIVNMNMPYYIRYMIKNYITSQSQFKLVKNKLSISPNHTMTLCGGNTQDQRYDFIENQINYDTHIIDLGCGEGFYVKKLIQKLNPKMKYFAFDIDSTEVEKVKEYKAENNITNLYTFDQYSDLFNKVKQTTGNFTILLTEVIEHIDTDKVNDFLIKVLQDFAFDKIIITTPDVDFNKNYKMTKQYRHDDHRYEYTKLEFTKLIAVCVSQSNLSLEQTFYQVGDIVDNDSMSQAIILTNPGLPVLGQQSSEQQTEMVENNDSDEIADDVDNELLGKDIKQNNRVNKADYRVNKLVENCVNFISGTVSPVQSNRRTNCDNLEDLYTGLKFLIKENQTVKFCAQPKYMGSRCNVYLFADDINQSYAVSRNGYRTLISQNLLQVYTDLHSRLKSFLEENNVKLLVLDGELLPWSAMGTGLIDNDFMPVDTGLKGDIDSLIKYEFEKHYADLKQKLDNCAFQQDKKNMGKKDFIKKYNEGNIKTFNGFLSFHKYYTPIQKLTEMYTVYHRQMELYTQKTEIKYKPFSILKIVYNDDRESVPLIDHLYTQSEMFKLLNDDEQSLFELSAENLDSTFETVGQFFNRKAFGEGYEGIMIKPEIINDGDIPMMKCRNPEYLTIIYGYNYREPHRYTDLVKRKTTSRKISESIAQFKLGMQMLQVPYNEIGNDEHCRLMYKFIGVEKRAEELDPRL